MTKQRRSYSTEYKLEAASLVLDQDYSVPEASRSLGINENVLRRWVKQLRDERLGTTPQGKALTPEQQRINKMKQLRETINAIEKCQNTSGYKAKSMILHGVSGTGKSTIAKNFIKNFPAVEEAERRHIPVLYVPLTQRSSSKSVAKAILYEIGGLPATIGDEFTLTKNLIEYIDKLGIELIIIDEIQHVLPGHSEKRTQEVADLIKAVTDTAAVPFVLIGTPDATRLITDIITSDKTYDQLRKRFRKSIALEPFTYGDGWVNLLSNYQKLVGHPCINLSTQELSMKLYLATEGLLGRLSNLFEEALELVDDDEQIIMATLCEAFIESEGFDQYGENPFNLSKTQVKSRLAELLKNQKKPEKD